MNTPAFKWKNLSTLKSKKMSSCPNNCGDIEILSYPQADCVTSLRYNQPSRYVFKPCDVDLPSPITNIGMKTLHDSGLIGFTSELANITFGDPTFEEIAVSDCSPALQVVNGRQITAEDRIMVQLTEGSPAQEAKFFDYRFWERIVELQSKLHFGIASCNGDVRWARHKDGTFQTISVTAFINYQRPSTQGGKFVEFKNIQINSNGDPLALWNIPEWNYSDAGINL